jgi:hypothetical protein
MINNHLHSIEESKLNRDASHCGYDWYSIERLVIFSVDDTPFYISRVLILVSGVARALG